MLLYRPIKLPEAPVPNKWLDLQTSYVSIGNDLFVTNFIKLFLKLFALYFIKLLIEQRLTAFRRGGSV